LHFNLVRASFSGAGLAFTLIEEGSMKLTKVITSVAVIVGLGLIGCSKNDSNSSRDTMRNSAVAPTGATNVIPSGYYTQVSSYISASEQQARTFLLPSVGGDASKIGSIGSNAVKIVGYVYIIRSNGQMDPSSYVQINVRDSLAGTTDANGQSIPEFVIKLFATRGGVNGSSVDMSFGDNFGEVRITGSLSNSQLTGNVSFTNFNPSANGTLGQFAVQTCGFIDCGK
jgi:hypothetical protein